ncbi:oligosaccharide flippase family protein [bacterium]|nr:oligosaccharide flippase family protein [bacterium]
MSTPDMENISECDCIIGQNQSVADNMRGIGHLSKNAGISGLGDLIAMAFAFLTSILITRVVGAEIYGVFLLGNTVISVMMIFALFGMNSGVVRYVARYNADNDTARIKGTIISAFMITLTLSIFFSIVSFIFAKVIATSIFNNDNVTIAIRLIALSMPFLAINNISASALQGFHAIKEYVFIEHVLKYVVNFVFLIILFLFGLRLMGLLLANVIDSILITCIAFLILMKTFPFMDKNIKGIFQIRELISFSWPLFFTRCLSFFMHWTDILMLGFFLTPKEVGIYGVVHKFMPFIVMPLKSFNVVFAPLISDMHTKGDIKMLESHFKLITKWVFTICFPVSILLVLFSGSMMRIFGNEFLLGSVPLIIITLGELVDTATGSCGYIIVMTGRSRLSLFNSIASSVVNVLLNYLLIPKHGMTGAALATAIAIAMINLMRIAELYYLMKIHPYSRKMLKPLCAGLVCLIFFYLIKDKFAYILELNRFAVILPSMLFIILYAALLYLAGLDEEDRFVLRKISRRFGAR